MSYWIELHCDAQRNGRRPGALSHGCVTLAGDNPGTMVYRRERASKALTRLCHQARQAGWVRRGADWTCPFCNGTELPSEKTK